MFEGHPRIVVTGAHGFVGRHLVARLAGLVPPAGELVLVDRHGGIAPSNGRVHTIDITDQDAVDKLVGDEQPTHLIHLAAIAAVTEASADERLAWAINFSGTQNLARAVKQHAPDCRFVFCSSAEVYGASFAERGTLDEAALLQPVNPYGAAKAAADIMIGQMARAGLRAVRLRPFNHTGAGQSEQFVLPAFAAQIARIEHGKQEPVISVGNLSSARDFLDVRDVVSAYVAALSAFDRLPNGLAINIASGKARIVQGILETMLAKSNARIEVRADPMRLRPSDTPVICGDASLAHRLLDWQQRYAFDDTVDSVLDDWRARV